MSSGTVDGDQLSSMMSEMSETFEKGLSPFDDVTHKIHVATQNETMVQTTTFAFTLGNRIFPWFLNGGTLNGGTGFVHPQYE